MEGDNFGGRIAIVWRYLFVGLVTLIPLAGCGQPDRRELPGKIKPGVVLITYAEGGGNGSGFFVEGEKGVCTVLTAAHVVQNRDRTFRKGEDIVIQIEDGQRSWRGETVRPLSEIIDLALITFSIPEQKCPHPTLSLGNSDELQVLDEVYAVGFPVRSGEIRLVKQFSPVEISGVIDPFPDGYGISFTGTTAGGMSGGPIVDGWGKVVGIHGKTDVELVAINNQYQSSLSPEQQEVLKLANQRSEQVQRNEHFKWAIPIRFYQEKIIAEKAIELTPNSNSFARVFRGVALVFSTIIPTILKRLTGTLIVLLGIAILVPFIKLLIYEIKILSYDKAIEFKPDDYTAWYNRGDALEELGKYEEAIASYDKALEFDPNNTVVQNNRANLLKRMKN